MAEIQRQNLYQPTSLGQGFDPIKAADWSALLRDNNQIQNEEQRAFALAQQQDAEIKARQLQYQDLAENQNMQALAGFSKLLQQGMKEYISYKDQQAQEEAEQIYNKYEKQQQLVDVTTQTENEKFLQEGVEEGDDVAIQAVKDKVPYDVVKEVRGSNARVQYYFAKKSAEESPKEYKNYFDDIRKTSKDEIRLIDGTSIALNTPVSDLSRSQFNAIHAEIEKRFMEQSGLNTIPRGIRAKYALPQIEKTNDEISKAFMKAYAVNQSFIDRGNFREIMINEIKEGNPDAVKNYVGAVASTVDGNNKPLMKPQAFKRLLDDYVQMKRDGHPQASALLRAIKETEFNGSTYGRLKSLEIDDAIYEGRKKAAEAFKASQTQATAAADKKALELLNYIQDNPEMSLGTFQNMLKGYKKYQSDLGILNPKVPEVLEKAWYSHSLTAEKIDARRQHLEVLKDAKMLSVELLQGEHKILREEFMEDAEHLDDMKGKLHQTNLDALKDIVTKDRRFKTSFEGAGISKIVVKDIQNEYMDLIKDLAPKYPNITDSVELGEKVVLPLLKDRIQNGVKDPTSDYYIDAMGRFPNYLPQATEAASSAFNAREKTREFLDYAKKVGGTRALNSKFLIDEDDNVIQDIVTRFNETGEMHPAVMSIADILEMNPIEVLSRRAKSVTDVKMDSIITFEERLASAKAEQPAMVREMNMILNGRGDQNMVRQVMSDGFPVRTAFADLVPTKGGLKGLTEEDYRYLGYAVSGEARHNTDDVYGVVASILNRVADPKFPNTVKEVVLQENQYEAVTIGTARFDEDYAQHFASEEGQQKIRAAMNRLQGRQDFKGTTMYQYMGPGDVKFADNGNFFHYTGQTANSGRWSGPITSKYKMFFAD